MNSKEDKLEKLRKISGIVSAGKLGSGEVRHNPGAIPESEAAEAGFGEAVQDEAVQGEPGNLDFDGAVEEDTAASDYAEAMESAVRLLAARNHAEGEIRRKLSRKGYDPEAISRVIRELRRSNYIDDEATAGIYLKELIRKGYGSHKVRSMMTAKGLGRDLVDRVMSDHYTDREEREIARRMLEKKMKTLKREKDPGKRKEKAYRYLYSRGISASIIGEVVQYHDDETF